MFSLMPWLALPGSDVIVKSAGGRALIHLGARHARRLAIGVDREGVPCIGFPIVDARTMSTTQWEKAVLGIGCIRKPPASAPDDDDTIGDFLCVSGKETRNGGRFALWFPAVESIFDAINGACRQLGTMSEEGHGRLRVGYFYYETEEPAGPRWLPGEDNAIIPFRVTDGEICDEAMIWGSSSNASDKTRGRRGARRRKNR